MGGWDKQRLTIGARAKQIAEFEMRVIDELWLTSSSSLNRRRNAFETSIVIANHRTIIDA